MAAMVTGALTSALVRAIAGEPSQMSQPSWTQRISSGDAFGVMFDNLQRPRGTIRPQGLYVVIYRPGDGSWTASGPMNPDGYQANVTYPGGGLCNPGDGVLCIWGAAFTFDDAGQVLYGGGGSPIRVGRLQPLTRRDRIAAGIPFSVTFDALSTNIGTIRAGAQYQVTFRPVERAWHAAGPLHPAGFQEHTDPVASALCDPSGYALCIWGAAFRFDEQDRVMSDDSGVVGRIRQ
jgi:hypothetical protein